jgi:hypothetical protein
MLALLAVGALLIAFVVLHPTTDYRQGVTNAKIDSPLKFEFDYHAAHSCRYEDVVYVFFDAKGNRLGRFADTTMNAVVAGKDYHYIVTADQPSVNCQNSVSVDNAWTP